MRFNSKILSVIISLAFVGGMFSAVYAGSVIATITLDGNVHTTGDSIVDGDLSVGGVSFAALDARIAALEAGTDPTIPIISMIDTHDTQITTLEDGTDTTVPMLSMVSDHGIMIDANVDAITINALDIESNAQAIEEGGGGGGPSPCDGDGDGSITAQEIHDYMLTLGIDYSVNNISTKINQAEAAVLTPPENNNGVLDTPAEIADFNVKVMFPFGTSGC